MLCFLFFLGSLSWGLNSYYSFNFNTDEAIAETESVPAVNFASNYSKETLNLLQELKSSIRSAKERRIGEILTECLPKGIVTESDYIRHNEKSKWTSDMKFAVLLGLVENIGKSNFTRYTAIISFICESTSVTFKNTF